MNDPQIAAIENAKKASVLQLLFKCARLANEQALEQLKVSTGNQTLRQAHTSLFPYIDFEGTRLTTIADKLGISKQAVSQLVNELEAMGMVERISDPSDGRAKLVRFGAQGQARMLSGLGVLQALAGELEAELGKKAMQQFHQTLLKLEAILEARQQD